jgi:hypothetical protein
MASGVTRVANKRTHPDRPTLRPTKKVGKCTLSRFFSKLLVVKIRRSVPGDNSRSVWDADVDVTAVGIRVYSSGQTDASKRRTIPTNATFQTSERSKGTPAAYSGR